MQDLMHALEVPYILETVAFLLTVVVIVPLCKRIKVSPIIGFLAIGAVIGPHSLDLVGDAKTVQHVAELGVILLLFTIGLELSFERLAAFSKQIFGLGSAHFILCASAIGVIAYQFNNTVQASIVLGMCLALSSTAVVMQLLNERGEIASVHGRSVFSVLLFQDLMVVPVLIMVTIFGSRSDGSVTGIVFLALLKAIIAIGAIIFIGRYVLRYLFRVAARTHAVEVFMAATLLVILCTAALTGISGLSMALGAFLAGLLLAETEYKHQIETDIEPFKGLFLGLFFMGVGMNINFEIAFDHGFWLTLAVLGLITVKGLCGFIAALIFKLNAANAFRMSLLLAEAGEFAFLVIGQASLNYSVVDVEVGQFMVVVAGISMALTPVLALIAGTGDKLFTSNTHTEETTLPNLEDENNHVIIAGFGRVGNAIAGILNKQSIPYIALDLNSDNVSAHHQDFHAPVYLGDASNTELLKRCGIEKASAMIITMDNPTAALNAVATVHKHWPELPIIVRSKNDEHSEALTLAGASKVVPEIYESSLQLASHVLKSCNYTHEQAEACIELVRRHNYEEIQNNA